MRKVLITGGSRGIGAALVRRFAAAGDAVAFVYCSNEEKANEVARTTGACAIRADVSSPEGCHFAFDRAVAYFGTPDVLVNNAGISVTGLLSDTDDAQVQKLLAVNLTAPIFFAREASRGMVVRHEGVIVNVGSVWGRVGASCETVYSASKAGLRGFTLALSKELAPSGIRVNCVEPGVIDTDMNRHYGEETLAALAEETPLARLGTPEDVANAVWFLASDEAKFITGQILGVDGGFGQ